jgi:nicotinate phosphoribosyltransferase
MGGGAHAFTLLHNTEEEAFEAQVATMGPGTTLLVDTYDVRNAVELAVKVAGPELGAVRLDSGDLPVLVGEVRAQLDSLGATNTRITVTNDLDEYTIAALRAAPVDSYGVGTSVVTGSGYPAAGMVYKLVARKENDEWISVAKKSTAKATVGGRKTAVRTLENGVATTETLYVGGKPEASDTERPLLVTLIDYGTVDDAYRGVDGTALARETREASVAELPLDALRLSRGEPALPTVYHTLPVA